MSFVYACNEVYRVTLHKGLQEYLQNKILFITEFHIFYFFILKVRGTIYYS